MSLQLQLISIFSILMIIYVTRNYGNLKIRTYTRFVFANILLVFIIFSLFPASLTFIAKMFGVTRGADFVIYLTALSLLGLSGILIAKFREIEISHTRLIREIALENYKRYKEE
jgi:hypothetical protein